MNYDMRKDVTLSVSNSLQINWGPFCFLFNYSMCLTSFPEAQIALKSPWRVSTSPSTCIMDTATKYITLNVQIYAFFITGRCETML